MDLTEMVYDFSVKHRFPRHVTVSPMDSVLQRISKELLMEAKRMEPAQIQRGSAAYRAHLLLEELGELFHAMRQRDRVQIADAIGDLFYVLEGTAQLYDIPTDAVLKEIHRSNMTKATGRDLRMRIKGPDYSPPDIRRVLDEYDGRNLASDDKGSARPRNRDQQQSRQDEGTAGA